MMKGRRREDGVKEPSAAYGEAHAVPALPGASIGVRARNQRELIGQIRGGFPYRAAERMTRELELTARELSEMLHIAPRTMARRKREGRLQADESDRLYRIATLVERAEEVLEGREAALRWLKSPKPALAGASPLEFADTEVGIQEVEALLGRLEYGVFG